MGQPPRGMEPVGARLKDTATVGAVAADDRDPASNSDESSDADDLDEVRDELSDDLDPGFVGPYVFPNNNRRRVPGYLYIFFGVVCVVVWALSRGGESVLVNFGVLAGGIGLGLIGIYHQIAGWNLDVDER